MDWTQKSEEEILDIATPIMDNLMQAATDIHFERHVRDFCPESKQALSQQSFEKQCKLYQETWGHFAARELLGTIKKSSRVWVIWRQFCTKSDDQFMASLCLIEAEGRIQVTDIGIT